MTITKIIHKNTNLKAKLKKSIYEWLENTTAHGISHCAKSKNWFMRVLWILFFLGSLGYCTFTIVQSVIGFLQYETTISITRVQELPAKFPAITICNINPFKSHDDIKNVSNDLFNCFNNTNENDFRKCLLTNYTNDPVDEFMDRVKRMIANLDYSDKSKFGFDLKEDMLISCEYNNEPCDENDFYQYWSNNYGNCYTFNGGNNNSEVDYKRTSKAGIEYGLKIELITKPFKYKNNFDYKSGLYLIVHNQSTSELTLQSGINIPTGFETYIGINKNMVNKLAHPYSDCLDTLTSENTYAKRLFGFFNDFSVSYYNQDFCYTVCYQDKLIEACGCCDIITPKMQDKSYCQTDSEIKCLRNFVSNFTVADVNVLCESACPQECNTVDYDLTLTSATFPTLSYLKYLKSDDLYKDLFPSNITASELTEFGRESILKIIVNFDKLDTTSIDDNPNITPDGLFGTLGGQLGLFIGMSMLSLFEIIDLIVELIFIIIKHKSEREQQENQEKQIQQQTFSTFSYPIYNGILLSYSR